MAPLPRAKSFHRPFDASQQEPQQQQQRQERQEQAKADRTSASSAPKSSSRSHSHPNTTKVLIGPKQVPFRVNTKLLYAASAFFREQLGGSSHAKPVSLWLPGESSSMFALFVEWLHHEAGFRWHLDDAVNNALDAGQDAAQSIHWALIRLHLFASHLALHQLQDIAMDAIQDLYLKCDWDVYPSLITYIYSQCDAIPAVRLRRWAVAMVAFSLSVVSDPKFQPRHSVTSNPSRFRHLLETLPEFALDYERHSRKMRASGLDVRFKNPQLRIPANKLLNDERAFGFRECSFHSHRATIGEDRCPHGFGRFKVKDMANGAAPLGFTAPAKRASDISPTPLFRSEANGVDQALKHIRSISSTLK